MVEKSLVKGAVQFGLIKYSEIEKKSKKKQKYSKLYENLHIALEGDLNFQSLISSANRFSITQTFYN